MMNADDNNKPATGLADSARSGQPDLVRVLLIEDNPGDARLIREQIHESALDTFQVECISRLSAGMQRLEQGDIALVLLDLSLPDSRGIDTFVKLHAKAPNVPVIVLSGLADETVAVQAVHEGAQDYLMKGCGDGHLLVRAMRYAIERSTAAVQVARYADELRRKNAQMEADMNMAREIQLVFLPQQYPTFPPSASSEQSAIRFYHQYKPAAAVGGDFFTVLPLNDSAAGIFICDVMGHGLRAALITAVMRGLVEELKPEAADAGQFLTALNQSLHAILRRTDEMILATAFYLIVDLSTRELRFASAGHPSPLHLSRRAGEVKMLKDYDARHGPAMGLFERSSYPTGRVSVSSDDLIVLYTDGLYEARGPSGEEFGQERLLDAVRQRVRQPVTRMFDELLKAVQQFTGSDDFEDDVCLVGVELAQI